jgi:tetratricopeptide (TPR) repeat protein
MQNYFQINGLVYQLVPILNNQANDGTMGRLNSDVMYENLMNKFKWGGMDQPGVYLDENHFTPNQNLRNLFYRLAIKLVEEGDNARAVKVLDKCIQVMPKENVPYDVFIVRLSEAYYAAGAVEKANALVREVAKSTAEKYNYLKPSAKQVKVDWYKASCRKASRSSDTASRLPKFTNRMRLPKELKAEMDKMFTQQ